MVDFFMISTRSTKRGVIEVYPKFIVKNPSSDLMIRGGDFYAIWIEEKGLWSTNEQDLIDLVDKELDDYCNQHSSKIDGQLKVLHMWDAENGIIDRWHHYCKKQMRDSYHMLDSKIIFANHKTVKEDYASKKLNYPLEECDISAYNTLMSTLYSPEERRKIEWAIGSIISGDSKKNQKFVVLYGAAGTGKSTILNIIQDLFKGYYSVFNAKALGSSNESFALESFRTNPLVAIQHDGDLSKIEDNTRLNSLVSHEQMPVNEKFRSVYISSFNSFLFMGTNKPVKITDAKSGLIRRLIDVKPSGNKLSPKDYISAIKKIDFELGGIAKHCLDVYLEDPGYYDTYIPVSMMGASNDFYNFVLDNYYIFENDDFTTLSVSWEMYENYCKTSNVNYPMSKRVFKEELKNYFYNFEERHFDTSNNKRIRSYYSGFRTDRFENFEPNAKDQEEPYKIIFSEQESVFDTECAECPAQYALIKENNKDQPKSRWSNVTTTLSSLDTSKLHYVKIPLNHIVIDFDIKDEDGQKSFERNLAEASKWPKTYAELSKSGAGIHLHYIYTGDPNKLSRIYDKDIEVKVFTGDSSLRRKLTKCNNEKIAIINSGLPFKKEKKAMVNKDVVQTEKGLYTTIYKCLNKEVHPGTKPCVDFIKKILDDMYESGKPYDVSKLYSTVWDFAANSTHHKDECIKMVEKMHFKSECDLENSKDAEGDIIFYDVEVFPNLFLINWKAAGENKPVIRMINPSPSEVEELSHRKLVGFNCRRYDNHILYARILGKSIPELYSISQGIINKDKNCFFGKAYDLSYTDVYDFSSKKQSLKKFEIELGILHKELGLPWDKPVPEERWQEVAEYCDNDVIATEAVFNARKADFTAREILADIAGMTVNDTTNSLTTRIIFGCDKNPQGAFCYRDLAIPVVEIDPSVETFFKDENKNIIFDRKDPSLSLSYNVVSKLPFFPGYEHRFGKSTYRGEEVGEGGYVYSEPGMYGNVALLDIASMHPSSIVDECLFGPIYTKRFKDILDARLCIKHKDYDSVRKMFDGKLVKYLEDESTAKDLAQALKIAINSVYGLTSASFINPFRDPRNQDNIVAKRGALFMIDLKHEVQKRGFTVAHIKTDSIKIPDATPEIISFVIDFGKKYGYNFEHEATYDRMCLVNDAVYIAKYADNCEHEFKLSTGEKIMTAWTATGTQFQVPYVFKKLFSNTKITFNDLCETKSVTTALYLDNNEPKIMRIYEDLAGKIETYLPLKGALTDYNDFEKALEKLKVQYSDEELHDYHFVGKVGRFCPIKIGENGGLLVREKDGKYYAATGSKGYRWVESWMIQESEEFDKIDRSYYDDMVTEAAKSISLYGDLEWFTSDDPYIGPEIKDGKPVYKEETELPWAM